jgi:hypothetical protein
MSTERFQVLDMLRRQVLTVQEANQLLVALEENSGTTVELTVNLVQLSLNQADDQQGVRIAVSG